MVKKFVIEFEVNITPEDERLYIGDEAAADSLREMVIEELGLPEDAEIKITTL